MASEQKDDDSESNSIYTSDENDNDSQLAEDFQRTQLRWTFNEMTETMNTLKSKEQKAEMKQKSMEQKAEMKQQYDYLADTILKLSKTDKKVVDLQSEFNVLECNAVFAADWNNLHLKEEKEEEEEEEEKKQYQLEFEWKVVDVSLPSEDLMLCKLIMMEKKLKVREDHIEYLMLQIDKLQGKVERRNNILQSHGIQYGRR